MSRNPACRLEDIIEAAKMIEAYLEGYDYQSFVADRRTVDAVTRNLEIIGEAVKHLPPEMTSDYPDVPWKAIAGFRDILAHGYFRVDNAIVWDAASRQVAAIMHAAGEMLDK